MILLEASLVQLLHSGCYEAILEPQRLGDCRASPGGDRRSAPLNPSLLSTLSDTLEAPFI